MLKITIATRKYKGEKYTYILNIPDKEGEKGCCNIEIEPYIIVNTPENAFGYEDTFFYDGINNNGYFSYRYHPEWIKRKIIDTCNRLMNKALDKYYYKAYPNGKYDYSRLEGVEWE